VIAKLTLASIRDVGKITELLSDGGFDTSEAMIKARHFAKCAEELRLSLPSDSKVQNDKLPVSAFFVPGRIEILGKHTDYAGGKSIVVALQYGFCIVAIKRNDRQLVITDIASNEKVQFEFSAEIEPEAGRWSNYPMTTAKRLAKNYEGPLYGADIAFISDLPAASGMSSSSAMIVAFAMVLMDINRLAQSSEYKANIKSMYNLAGYLSAIENGKTFKSLVGDSGVGTYGGSEDHTAILCCKLSKMSCFSYCPVSRICEITLSNNMTFAIASSGIAAHKTGIARQQYNDLSRSVQTLVDIYNRRNRLDANKRKISGRGDDPGKTEHGYDSGKYTLADILSLSDDALEKLKDMIEQHQGSDFSIPELIKRLDHFHIENNEIIPDAIQTLQDQDYNQFGVVSRRSQILAQELLGNQISQTTFLAESAMELGAAAASSFGAGFGGSVWALIEKDQSVNFTKQWSVQYKQQFTKQADTSVFFISPPSKAMIQISTVVG